MPSVIEAFSNTNVRCVYNFHAFVYLCSGTNNGRSLAGSDNRIEDLTLMYQNCTRVYGNVEITHLTKTTLTNWTDVDFSRKLRIFEHIQEIKGYLLIYNVDIRSIDFPSLKIIWGDDLLDDSAALTLSSNMELKELRMPMLRAIHKGNVRIENSTFLCYLQSKVDWNEACRQLSLDGACVHQCPPMMVHDKKRGMLIPNPKGRYMYDRYCVTECPICRVTKVLTGSILRNLTGCEEIDGFIDIQDSKMRRVARIGVLCVPLSCAIFETYPSSSRSTDGYTRDDLNVLKSVRMISEYVQMATQTVSPRNLSFLENLEFIEGRSLVTSKFALAINKNDNLEQLGLRKLKKIKAGSVIITENHGLCYAQTIKWDKIIASNAQALITKNMDGKCEERRRICDETCDPALGCWGRGPTMCTKCRYWQLQDTCVNECPNEGCTGPGDHLGPGGCSECLYAQVSREHEVIRCLFSLSMHEACRDVIGHYPSTQPISGVQLVVCLAECPEEFPFLDEFKMCNRVDLNKEREKRSRMIAAIFATVFALLLISMLEQISNYVDIPEMTPVDPSIRSNMSRVNLITASELQTKGTQLGAGAFGVVYAGFWFPKGKGKIKVPVAIKLVKGMRTGKEESEMLNEAMQMSSLRHEHLLRLVVSLFTCRIVGHFSLQAMKYLYEHRVIHRDLAARNVLVKRHNHVEVTDFGLAKLLDYGQEKVKVMEGKVAIKWLALESLKDQSYTHRTDVWAFGVTCWEILTFGQVPVHFRGCFFLQTFQSTTLVKSEDKDGNRLSQPSNCSIELYQVLLQCWMANPESRPTFTMLHERFQNFCRIPHLYVEDQVTPQAFVETECQRDLLRELLNDTENDFTDPLNYFEMCENPETPTADFETVCSSIVDRKEVVSKHEYYNEAKHKAEYYNDIVSTQSEKQQLQVDEDTTEEMQKESCL
uniref:receptor protein-tyrosine kinase n=1 Tax=Angiostrongylus cantonensis TaxID=6313 RepID=A0A0K0DEY3_ANGCA